MKPTRLTGEILFSSNPSIPESFVRTSGPGTDNRSDWVTVIEVSPGEPDYDELLEAAKMIADLESESMPWWADDAYRAIRQALGR